MDGTQITSESDKPLLAKEENVIAALPYMDALPHTPELLKDSPPPTRLWGVALPEKGGGAKGELPCKRLNDNLLAAEPLPQKAVDTDLQRSASSLTAPQADPKSLT